MILTIDIGTTSFKTALFTPQGECRDLVYVPSVRELKEVGCTTPLPAACASLELHKAASDQWLRAFEDCMALLGAALSKVEAIVISGNGPSLVPVTGTPDAASAGDATGGAHGVLRLEAAPALLWLDRRAREESARVSELMGGFVDPSFFLPKALWIKNHEPALYEKTRYFLSCPEYLSCALTGIARTVFPSQGFDRWYWNREILDQLGLDAEKFPPFVSPGTIIGPLFPAIAQRFGIGAAAGGGGTAGSGDIPVIAGGPDFFAAILGAAAISPGDACDRSGTSEGINLCTQERIPDPRLMSYGHPISPYWNLSGIISTTGKALAWARDLLGLGAEPFEAFFQLAHSAQPGAGGLIFLPDLAGERAPIWDPHAKGTLLGLSLSTGRAEIARAVTEGICFAIRDVITVMEEQGVPVENLRVTGRPGQSDFLNQLKADITGKPVLIPAQREAELLGAAALGAAALGHYASAGEAVQAMVQIGKTYRPNAQHASLYDNMFREYREAYKSLKGNFARLDEGRGPQ
jgi:xylulokinase